MLTNFGGNTVFVGKKVILQSSPKLKITGTTWALKRLISPTFKNFEEKDGNSEF